MSKLLTGFFLALILSAVASFCSGFPTCPEFVTSTSGMIAGAVVGFILG